MIFASGLELLRRLRGHHIVVAVKMERAISVAVLGEQAHRAFAGLDSFERETRFTELRLEKIAAGLQIQSRRVFCRNGDEFGQQISHFVFVATQPVEKSGYFSGIAVQAFAHRVRTTMLGQIAAPPRSNLAPTRLALYPARIRECTFLISGIESPRS